MKRNTILLVVVIIIILIIIVKCNANSENLGDGNRGNLAQHELDNFYNNMNLFLNNSP